MAKVAALTMVYKDHWFLEKWLDHYAAHLGRDNLYVLSHGRDSRIDQLCRGANLSVLPRTGPVPDFDRKKADVLNTYIELLHDGYDAVIAADVDELVAADPAASDLPFAKFILASGAGKAAINCLAWELRPTVEDAPFDPALGTLQQRPHALCPALYCKPAISFRPIRLMPGQHGSDADLNLNRDFLLFHLRYANEAVFQSGQAERNAMAEAALAMGEAAKLGSHWAAQADDLIRDAMVSRAEATADYDEVARKAVRFMSANAAWDNRRGHMRFPFLPRRLKAPVRLPDRFLNLF